MNIVLLKVLQTKIHHVVTVIASGYWGHRGLKVLRVTQPTRGPVRSHFKRESYSKTPDRDFPGGPVVKTPCFQCRGRGFDPWSGNSDPTCGTAKKTQNKQTNKKKTRTPDIQTNKNNSQFLLGSQKDLSYPAVSFQTSLSP